MLPNQSDAIGVAEIVLRQSARPNGDALENRIFADGQNGSDFAMDQCGELRFGQLGGGRVRSAADESSEKHTPFGSAAREERRVPYGAEDVKTRGARNEEAETVEPVAEVNFSVAERNDGNRGIFDGREKLIKRGVELGKELSGNVGGSGDDQRLGGNGFADGAARKANVIRAATLLRNVLDRNSGAGGRAKFCGKGAGQSLISLAKRLECGLS